MADMAVETVETVGTDKLVSLVAKDGVYNILMSVIKMSKFYSGLIEEFSTDKDKDKDKDTDDTLSFDMTSSDGTLCDSYIIKFIDEFYQHHMNISDEQSRKLTIEIKKKLGDRVFENDVFKIETLDDLYLKNSGHTGSDLYYEPDIELFSKYFFDVVVNTEEQFITYVKKMIHDINKFKQFSARLSDCIHFAHFVDFTLFYHFCVKIYACIISKCTSKENLKKVTEILIPNITELTKKV